ncbi:ribose 5-phosphate isomerase A [Candidatus Synchoanobacter obligatus]|uniref:Ribose 5-phosphate isomerase A n=1 Tax=Candidatus Synchoanobacter obligatus TaxID=2919597 RepID=A0ABT1L4Q7_9GAMM|nr:ribose 5-phosphate isomerase A [Candidatus Synchoanobacter obligatus]MCP8352150.1 ribose 5-phosphate isomerase A [Candidatus Synchoanobacter obligatus]
MNKKQRVAEAALEVIKPDLKIGIGTGSTVDCLIALLPTIACPKFFVSSSLRTTEQLEGLGFEVRSLNDVGPLDVYIDGVDQVLPSYIALKGKGGAHTLEKVLATEAKKFVGMLTDDKQVNIFNEAIPVEVLPEARSAVSRRIVVMGGVPIYRQGKTDLGNDIIDVQGFEMTDPEALEEALLQLCGVVEVGIFAKRRFDQLYIVDSFGKVIEKKYDREDLES